MELAEIKEKIEYYLDKNMVFSALFFCEQLIKIESSEYSHFRYADVLRLCGFFSKSKKVFSQINADNIPIKYKYIYHLYLGHLFMDMGKAEEAKKEFKKCMEFESCDTAPYIYLASLLLGDENNDEAISYLEKALTKEGDIDEVYYNLATRLAIKRNFELALKMINNCLSLNPTYPNAKEIKDDLLEYQSLLKSELH